MLKIIKVIITKDANTDYWGHTEEVINNTMLTSTGETIEECKQDMIICYEELKLMAENEGEPIEDVVFDFEVHEPFNSKPLWYVLGIPIIFCLGYALASMTDFFIFYVWISAILLILYLWFLKFHKLD